MKHKFVLHLASIFIFSLAAKAEDQNNAVANLADDYAQCAAFYSLGNGAAIREHMAVPFPEAANTALAALTALKDGSIKKAAASAELSSKMEIEIVNKEGWARLILKYGDFCKALLENPSERIKYWEGQKQKIM